MLCLAQSLCGVGAVHFGLLAHPGLAEHGEKHDTSAGRQPVGDPLMGIAEAEAQLAELAAQMAGVRFVERGGLFGEQVSDAFGLLVVRGGNVLQPQPYLRLDLDRLAPAVHSVDDIWHRGARARLRSRSCVVAANRSHSDVARPHGPL